MNPQKAVLADTTDLTRFQEALLFAAQLHVRQKRKGTDIPYLAHLMAVASIVMEHGGTEDEAIAALLHDSIEDQAEHHGGADALRQDIVRRFGADVAAIVDGCTDAEIVPKPPWKERKEAYIAHIPHASASVRLVSCADKLHNARAILADYRAIGDKLWSRFKGGRDGTLWYYRSLVVAFQNAGSNAIVEELERVVSEVERQAAVLL